MSSYISWRVNVVEDEIFDRAYPEIKKMILLLLDNHKYETRPPHGFVRFDITNIHFQWTSQDVVDTILDNIEKASKLKSFQGLT